MAYTPYYPGGWQSGESGGTPITPAALNNMENGIGAVNPLFGLNEIYGNGTISDCNNAAIGVWYIFYASASHIPVTNAVGVLITVGSPGTGSGTVRYQIAFVRVSGIDGVYVRAMNSGTWGSWTKIAS